MTQRTINSVVSELKTKFPEIHQRIHAPVWDKLEDHVRTLLESERKEAVDAVSEYLPNLLKYEGKEVRFWQGYRKGIQQAVEALTKDTNNE